MLTRIGETGADVRATGTTATVGRKRTICVLFVEDDDRCSRAFSRALSVYGIDCVVARSLASARKLARDSGDLFDAVLLDLCLPDGRGEELFKDIERLSKQPGIVIFSNYLDEIRPEAGGYRLFLATKQTPPAVLAMFLRLAAKGHAESTVSRFARHFGLTPREASVLRRVARGTSPKQVALDSGCSLQAVYAHLMHIARKAECNSYHEVVAKLFQFSCHGLG